MRREAILLLVLLATGAASCQNGNVNPGVCEILSEASGGGTAMFNQVKTAGAPGPASTGEIIVKFKSDGAGPTVSSAARMTSMTLSDTGRRTSGGERIYRLRSAAGMSATAARRALRETVEELNALPEVEYAEPNLLLYPQATPNDPCYPLQWHYHTNGDRPDESRGGINLPEAWNSGTGSRDVVVAVLDTGILPDEADVARGNLVAGYDFVSDASNSNDNDGRDPDPTDPGDQFSSWHGTHVAGTIGAIATDNKSQASGVGWSVSVQPVRVLGNLGGALADIADGIRWAAGLAVPDVPANRTPARIINMSLGGAGACSRTFQRAIDDAYAQGVLIVVAAGNDGADAGNHQPASCNNIVTVAAGDGQGRLTSFSNYGQAVDIMAPGGDTSADTDGDGHVDGVLSVVKGGVEWYNGTSMAAPHVAGVAALMLSRNAGLSPARVSQMIYDNAIPRSAQECPRACGAGLLNAAIRATTAAR